VYINRDSLDQRINWTYAHEIAHIKLKHLEDYDCNSLNDRELWRLDREANIFTSNFLMPEEWIRERASSPLSKAALGSLRATFDVSWEALINRLDELGIQSRAESLKLFQAPADQTDWARFATENHCLNIEPGVVLSKNSPVKKRWRESDDEDHIW